MEANDGFTQEINPEDDPFAGSDLEFNPPAEDVPTVDREGNVIDAPAGAVPAPVAPAAQPAPGLPTLTPEQAAAEAQRYRQEHGEPEPTTPTTGEPTPDPTPPAASGGPTEAPAPQAAEPVPPTAAATPEPTPEPPAAESAPKTDTSAEAATSEAPTAPSAPEQNEDQTSTDSSPESAESADPDEAPEPQETKDGNNRVTKRKYLLFQVDGPGKLTQVTWYEDSKGKLTQRGAGAKRQKVVLARGTEDALKFGYAAVGAPPEAHLVAVAALHFQPKKIRPTPPEPMRQRLSIS